MTGPYSALPGNDKPATTVVMVADASARRPIGIERLRTAVLEALASIGTPLVMTMDTEARRYIECVADRGKVVVVADGTKALTRLRQQLPRSIDVTYCLLVSPTSFSHWGELSAEWSTGLAAAAGDRMIYLTDSALARTVIEQHLHATRADVRVVATSRSTKPGDQAARTWTFEAAAQRSDSEEPPAYAGVAWDFSGPRVQGPSATMQPADAALMREANRQCLRAIVAPRSLVGRPLRISILGHKLSFIDELARDLAHETGSSVELDEWKHLGAPSDVARAQSLLTQSDVVIGEWGRPNNVWIQKHAAPDKRLIVRVHRYEVTTDFPRAIDMDRFYAGVVIVPWVGRALVQQFGWPADKLVYIPNYVNSSYFRRRKLPGSEFTLGIVGITPDLKRLDLALDLLGALRAFDARYTLRVRGQLPTAHIHWGKNPRIAEQWGSVLARLRSDPQLRNAVFFDAPGRDMASWFEGVGVILSMSDLEGSHVALAEGMASGALPIARPWPGIRTLWPSEVIFDRMGDAVQQILRAQDPAWRGEAAARYMSHPSLDEVRVLRAWWDLVNGDRSRAQAAFGPIDWDADLHEPVEQEPQRLRDGP